MDKYDELLARLDAEVTHYICEEDCWYSCPKSGVCCSDREDSDECTCGADEENALRKDAAVAIRSEQQDSERLDWLETLEGNFYNLDRITSVKGVGFNRSPTLREAIDNLRKKK